MNETSENELDESEDVLTLDIDDDLEEEDAEGMDLFRGVLDCLCCSCR